MTSKKPPAPTPQSVTFLTPDDLAPILAKLEEQDTRLAVLEAGAVELEARAADHDTLLQDHEERLVALESIEPVEPPVIEPPTGQDHVCPTVAEFLTALAEAEAGDTITLTAGATYDTASGFTLRNHGGEHPITIRSSMHASLPVGQRVSPGDLAKMPCLRSTAINTEVIEGAYGAGYWTLLGLAITTTHDTQQQGLVLLPKPASNYSPASEDELPHHITIDRCLVYGKAGVIASGGSLRGIQFNVLDSQIINSYIYDFRYDYNDNQAIWIMMGKRLVIENNYIEAAGENLFVGGSATTIDDHVGFIASDIEVRGNHIAKPRYWNPFDPTFGSVPGSCVETPGPGTLTCTGTAGTTTVAHGISSSNPFVYNVKLPTGEQRRVATWVSATQFTLASPFTVDPVASAYTRMRAWQIKNLIEIKVGERILIEDNLIERCWPAIQDGRAILFNTKNDNDRCPWHRIRDITFRYNWVKNIPACLTFADVDAMNPCKSNRTVYDPGPGGTITTVGTAATFSVPHGLTVGDIVRITSGAEAAPRSFGRMVSAVVDATHVTLNDTFRLGAGGAATNVTDQTWEQWTTLEVSHGLLIEHNVFEHQGVGENGAYGHPTSLPSGTVFVPAVSSGIPSEMDIVIRHNTVSATSPVTGAPFYLGDAGDIVSGLVIQDNIVNFGDPDGPNIIGSFIGGGVSSNSNTAIARFTVNSTFAPNVFYGPGATATNQPAGNYWEPVIENVGWDDPATGRFELTRGPYRAGQAHCASDGTDMGADVAAVRARVFGGHPD